MKRLFFITIVCAFMAGPAWADFTGHDVGLRYYYPNLSTVLQDNGVATVGPGLEFDDVLNGYGNLDVSVSSNTIVVTFDDKYPAIFVYPGPGGFNGWRLDDRGGAIEDIIGVTINPATNMAGLDASDISFDADNVYVNWGPESPGSVPIYQDTVVALDVQFVPVPGAILLGLLGLGAAGIKLRKYA